PRTSAPPVHDAAPQRRTRSVRTASAASQTIDTQERNSANPVAGLGNAPIGGMRRFLGIAAVTLTMAGAPTVARAETSAPGADALLAGIIVGATAVGALDITFLAYDTVKLCRGERFGTGLAITEIVLTAPQIAVGIYLTSKMWNEVGVSC